ncbi:MAG: hypothetical protein QOJ98_1546, partial [Acidobacteriota bacterium]|nr:hypothetical protein [Acidobacteriota bacterium]
KGVIAGIAAGIFARKVRSVAAGIAFGLAVGLVLAYGVAAMEGKYYFEIMLPGGIVGAILGWATQRYGRPANAGRSQVATALMFVLALTGVSAYADHDHAAKPADASAAFEKLKALAGDHSPAMMTADGEKTKVGYRVTANGTAVIETMFAGDPHEMVTVYSLDNDSVAATHYCSGGNQPRMKLNTEKSNANELVFDFVSITGKVTDAGHIKAVRFRFDDQKVEEIWSTSKQEDYLRLFYPAK